MVFKDKFEVKGFVKKWKGIVDFGNVVWCWFCEECGFFIVYDFDVVFEIIVFKGGSLDIEFKKDLKFVSY